MEKRLLDQAPIKADQHGSDRFGVQETQHPKH